jgi:penicillin-binding protein 1A
VRAEAWRLLATGLTVALAISTVFAAASFVGAVAVERTLPDLPAGVDVADIEDLGSAIELDRSRPSVVMAADGTVIGRFKAPSTHIRLRSGPLPDAVVKTVLAAEDAGFWDHGGYEPSAIARAFVANLGADRIAQGGSTITQQVAKLLFTGGRRTLERKLEELRTAIDLEANFSKHEILRTYLDSVYLGGGAFGVEAAAATYFRRPAEDLTLAQAALIAGIIPAPTDLDPRVDPQAAEARRQHVLDRLEELGWYGDTELEQAREDRPPIHPPKPAIERYPYFLDYVRRYLLDVAGIEPAVIYGGGLTIRTTLQPAFQEAALEAVHRHLPSADGPTAAVAVIDNHTGGVVALTGGRDFERSAVNLALGRLGGGSGRQVGSAFKPFVLAAALEEGHSLLDKVEAPRAYLPRTVPDPKPVHNYNDRGYGNLTLLDATRRSVNTAFMSVIESIGTPQVAELAERAGVRSLPPADRIGPSLAIGAYESSPLEMAGAYATFATGGLRVHPTPIATRRGGGIPELAELPMGLGSRVMERDTALLVTEALQGVVEAGTATRARLDRPVAAKTGTTNDYADAWLVGYTPQVTAAVWVGHSAGKVPMRNVAGVRAVTGGSVPASIWRAVMAAVHHARPPAQFPAAPERPPMATSSLTTIPPPSPVTNPAGSSRPEPTTTTASPKTSEPPGTTTSAAPATSTSTTSSTAPTSTTSLTRTTPTSP